MALEGIVIDGSPVLTGDATDEQLQTASDTFLAEIRTRANAEKAAETQAEVEAYRDSLTDLVAHLVAEDIGIDVLPDTVDGGACILVFPVLAVEDPRDRAIWGGVPVLFNESVEVKSATSLENPDVPGVKDRIRCSGRDAKTILSRTLEHLVSSGIITPAE